MSEKNKKAWVTPQLIGLVRGGAESVLVGCKTSTQTGSSSSPYWINNECENMAMLSWACNVCGTPAVS